MLITSSISCALLQKLSSCVCFVAFAMAERIQKNNHITLNKEDEMQLIHTVPLTALNSVMVMHCCALSWLFS
jgi:hypothetical protein